MKKAKEFMRKPKTFLKEIILGGQDGLVNVLGIVLAVATATKSIKIVLIARLAAAFAESISMGAVGYTSYKSGKEFYLGQVEKEKKEMKEVPHIERAEVEEIYQRKGFKGNLLKQIVDHITSKKKLWLETMMLEELRLCPDEYEKPLKTSFLIGLTALIGSFIPLLPFFFMNVVGQAVTIGIILSVIALFATGIIKAKVTVGNPLKQGFEMVLIGIGAAFVGYLIGLGLGAI